MKHFFSTCLLIVILLAAATAQAQYVITANLGPYQQNFDGMGRGSTTFSGGSNNVTLPGIISGYNAGGYFMGLPSPIYANDGTTTGSAAYNFGTANAIDRALGGIAGGEKGNSGTGYICVRLRNRSKTTIKNLDIRYAIEQWFNSTLSSEADFKVSYRKYADTTSFNNNDLVQSTGNNGWASISDLTLKAPATGGIYGKVDGNSDTYRRTAQYRLTGVNMAHGTEIVLRFTYVFSAATNGNGISMDDIVIYPETNVLYSSATGLLSNTANDNTATWSMASNSISPPGNAVDFTAPNYTYYVQGNSATNRANNWRVTGANSRVVVGTDASPASLYVGPKDKITATIDVAKGSTLDIDNPLTSNSMLLALGSLSTGSTVRYSATTAQNVLPATYSNLVVANSTKTLTGNVTVATALTLNQAVRLGSYNLTMLREADLDRVAGGQVVTNGTGEYRATVVGAGTSSVPVLFPVANAEGAANYLPVSIKAGANDLDDTYRVRILDKVYTTYTTSGTAPDVTYATGPTATTNLSNVNATWLISHETTTPVAATLKLGWDTSKEGSSFKRADAHIDHYTTSRSTWDGVAQNIGYASEGSGQWSVQRTGVSNFSPFAITSNMAGPLPVQLVAFAARRAGATVVCSWNTATEQNSAYFAVERSTYGTEFKEIARVNGQGASTATHAYSLTDAQAMADVAYYRLRQVDTDGTATYSPTVAVAGATAGSEAAPVAALTASPNPSTGYFVLSMAYAAATRVQGSVVNALGQQVLAIDTQLPAGPATLPLDLRAQPAGVYLVQLLGPSGPATLRLLKQ